MKKNVLIVIHSLGCGGAEKSLVSLLSFLPADKWNIDLLVADRRGMFVKEIPDYVNQITDLYDFENYAAPVSNRRKKICGVRDFFCQVKWQIFSRIPKLNDDLSWGEKRWKLWGRYLPKMKKEYDLAVSYMNGFPNYFVVDKVKASKKILWVHNEFEKLGYNYEFEYGFYKAADRIVTISQACVDSILRVYPEFKEKTVVLENISSPSTINTMAKDVPRDEYMEHQRIKLLSIGRLSEQKRFDLAVKAAKILKERNLDFLWYILGEGELRDELTSLIEEYELKNNVKLIGVKDNPYPYIKACDIFVQTSEYEGKSIVLDEAKILCRPIVVTNYKTVNNSIKNDVNGLIVDINEESIAEGIYNLMISNDKRNSYSMNLESDSDGNESEIEKYISLFEMLMGEKVFTKL